MAPGHRLHSHNGPCVCLSLGRPWGGLPAPGPRFPWSQGEWARRSSAGTGRFRAAQVSEWAGLGPIPGSRSESPLFCLQWGSWLGLPQGLGSVAGVASESVVGPELGLTQGSATEGGPGGRQSPGGPIPSPASVPSSRLTWPVPLGYKGKGRPAPGSHGADSETDLGVAPGCPEFQDGPRSLSRAQSVEPPEPAS